MSKEYDVEIQRTHQHHDHGTGGQPAERGENRQ